MGTMYVYDVMLVIKVGYMTRGQILRFSAMPGMLFTVNYTKGLSKAIIPGMLTNQVTWHNVTTQQLYLKHVNQSL